MMCSIMPVTGDVDLTKEFERVKYWQSLHKKMRDA